MRSLALQFPHRALIAPRVRATVDFLLESLQEVEALHLSMQDLKPFAV